MPIYAYRCDSCGHAKDVLQKVSDAVLTDCPACGAATFRKQITAAGFQLKGSGWYATDFKTQGAAANKPAEGAESAKPAEGVAPAKAGESGAPAKTADAAKAAEPASTASPAAKSESTGTPKAAG